MVNRRQSGPLNVNWKGGRTVASSGYVLLKRPDHPDADIRGYVYEHRVVAEQKIGRKLRNGEQVHHINGNKTDNRPENIEVAKSRAHHALEHRYAGVAKRLPDEPNPRIYCACACGETLLRYDSKGRERRFITGHNMQKGARRG